MSTEPVPRLEELMSIGDDNTEVDDEEEDGIDEEALTECVDASIIGGLLKSLQHLKGLGKTDPSDLVMLFVQIGNIMSDKHEVSSPPPPTTTATSSSSSPSCGVTSKLKLSTRLGDGCCGDHSIEIDERMMDNFTELHATLRKNELHVTTFLKQLDKKKQHWFISITTGAGVAGVGSVLVRSNKKPQPWAKLLLDTYEKNIIAQCRKFSHYHQYSVSSSSTNGPGSWVHIHT